MLSTHLESDWETVAPDDELPELNRGRSLASRKRESHRRTVNVVLSDSHISFYTNAGAMPGCRQTLPVISDSSGARLEAKSPTRLQSFYSSSSIYSNSEEGDLVDKGSGIHTRENGYSEVAEVTRPPPAFNRSISKSCLIQSQSKTSSSVSTDHFLYDSKRYTAVDMSDNRQKGLNMGNFNTTSVKCSKNPLDSFYNNGAVLST